MVVCRSGTARVDARATPGEENPIPRPLNSADSASTRIVIDTRRTRSRSASNRSGGCPHDGPSVKSDAAIGFGPSPPR